jgi:hypothetical protein
MEYLKHLLNQLRQRSLAWLYQHKERTVENNKEIPIMYTEEQLMARLKFFIGICLSLTLFGIVFVVLYSLIFVTQPLNAISPIDQKFFELIVPIATFLTGTLSGIMLAGNNPEAQQKALEAANKGWDKPPAPIAPNPVSPAPSSFGSAPATGFGAPTGGFGAQPTSGFGAPASGFGIPVVTLSSTGKPMPAPAPEPEL